MKSLILESLPKAAAEFTFPCAAFVLLFNFTGGFLNAATTFLKRVSVGI
jgi:peptidoglycan biosynthesis protein MviN/MurJ (putative lipid II flippase)